MLALFTRFFRRLFPSRVRALKQEVFGNLPPRRFRQCVLPSMHSGDCVFRPLQSANAGKSQTNTTAEESANKKEN
jgi:hypothetical protein